MLSSPRLQFVDRSGNLLATRYIAAMERLRVQLWRRYPQVQDQSDRDKVMEETLCRVADFEQKNGEAEELTGVIRRLFRSVVVSLLRKSYYQLRLEAIGDRDFERLSATVKPNPDVPATAPFYESEDALRQIAIRQFLERLPEKEREIILLTARGFKANDVAKKMGVSVANVYQIGHRVRTKARKLS